MKRRTLLQSALSAAVLATSAGCGGARSQYRLFSATEADTLAALLNQIIPDDETPGAVGANVIRFLDRHLARAYVGHRAAYRKGLQALEDSAHAVYQRSFSALRFEEQEALVERMEKGDLPAELWGDLPPREFFRTVRTHSMQGYYGDPRHGGNQDALSWRALGVPHPPVRGRDDYYFPKQGAAAMQPLADRQRP
ncbi:MAG: gluconate 2-dehydrogenase subunit 3 family protein [Bryobacterales bacterium]|nr:gluconate 2-dehydrogenase subunit 3 family protein [Bryobacterales bacterium]